MRITLIASSYAPAIGGVEEHVRAVASALNARGHDVEVWTVERDGDYRQGVVDGIRVRYLPTPLPAAAPRAVARFSRSAPAAFRQWRAAEREFRPDLLHVQCFGPNGVYALALSQRANLPLFVTSHGETLGDDDGVYADSALLRTSLRLALRRAVAVTAPSEYVLDDLRRRFGLLGGEVVVNGIETGHSPSVPRSAGRYLFAVGRLGRMKGFDLLLEAFSQASLDGNVRLIIGGDGPERRALEALTADPRLKDRVEFRGWLAPDEVAATMAAAMAVVVPSRSEAFGIVALEAWRAGAPLVMTSRGGAAEFITDGEDGLLVDPTDTLRLAATLERIVQDDALRRQLSEKGSARVHRFGWERVVADYEDIYARELGITVQ